MKIVFASNNAGKIRELRDGFKSFPIELIPQAELDVPEVPETGVTFIENALIKARHASRMTKLPAIADDSGLAVQALYGAPGIYSARYAGEGASSADNIKKLLHAMEHIPDDQRNAAFHCVLVFMLHEQDPVPLVCDGIWHGRILREPQGSDGFGYDPVFYVPDENKSAAELTIAQKNRISHRGQALQLLFHSLPEKMS